QPAVSMRRQRAVHEGREWEVEGYDAHSGDAVLRDLADVDRLAETVQIRQLKAANLDSDGVYREFTVGDGTYYRDAEGNVFVRVDMDEWANLVPCTDLKIVPRDQIALQPEAAPVARRRRLNTLMGPAQPPDFVLSNKAVYENGEFDLVG